MTVGYLETVRHLIAWCELRQGFRSFWTDRVTAAGFLDERYPERPSVLRTKWRRSLVRARQASRENLTSNAHHKCRFSAGGASTCLGFKATPSRLPSRKSKPLETGEDSHVAQTKPPWLPGWDGRDCR